MISEYDRLSSLEADSSTLTGRGVVKLVDFGLATVLSQRDLKATSIVGVSYQICSMELADVKRDSYLHGSGACITNLMWPAA